MSYYQRNKESILAKRKEKYEEKTIDSKKYEKRTGASNDMATYMRNYRRKKNMLIPFQSKDELRQEIQQLRRENESLRKKDINSTKQTEDDVRNTFLASKYKPLTPQQIEQCKINRLAIIASIKDSDSDFDSDME